MFNAVVIPALVLSSLSAAFTGTVIVYWLFSSSKARQDSFRYALVINLAIAEFVNSTNNTISGIYVLITRDHLPYGTACNLNGWVGQVSVQAADFSILAIAIVTLLTFNFHTWVLDASEQTRFFICVMVWCIPLITGTIAVAMNRISPASGNWCWISEKPRYLRYVLGHGWRFTIFAAVIFIYLYMFAAVCLRVRNRRRLNYGDSRTSKHMAVDILVIGKARESQDFARRPTIMQKESLIDQEMRQWLSLSIYPILYIIMWIPGLANRFVEMSGGSSSLLTALQASTQATGLVNAIAFLVKENPKFFKWSLLKRHR